MMAFSFKNFSKTNLTPIFCFYFNLNATLSLFVCVVMENNILFRILRSPVAQLVERRAVTRGVAGSSPGRINTQDLKITWEKVLPL